jgi:hypothetical protein
MNIGEERKKHVFHNPVWGNGDFFAQTLSTQSQPQSHLQARVQPEQTYWDPPQQPLPQLPNPSAPAMENSFFQTVPQPRTENGTVTNGGPPFWMPNKSNTNSYVRQEQHDNGGAANYYRTSPGTPPNGHPQPLHSTLVTTTIPSKWSTNNTSPNIYRVHTSQEVFTRSQLLIINSVLFVVSLLMVIFLVNNHLL